MAPREELKMLDRIFCHVQAESMMASPGEHKPWGCVLRLYDVFYATGDGRVFLTMETIQGDRFVRGFAANGGG